MKTFQKRDEEYEINSVIKKYSKKVYSDQNHFESIDGLELDQNILKDILFKVD